MSEETVNNEPEAVPGEGEPGPEATKETASEQEVTETETGEETEEKEEKTEPEEGEEPPWFKKRFDKITAQRYEAERKAADLEREIAYLKGRVESKPEEEKPPAKEGPPTPPKQDSFETYDEYLNAREKYLDDLADYKVEERFKAREAKERAEQEKRAKEERARNFEEAVNTAREEMPDYDVVVGNPQLMITEVMADVIRESEVGPKVAYHLGKNPQDAARIAGLSDYAQAREIGKIEAGITAAGKKHETTQTTKATPTAPPPVKPLSGKKESPSVSTTDPSSDKLSTKDWMRREEERLRRKAGMK